MTFVPTRTFQSTRQDHLDDHNELSRFHNTVDAKGDLLVGISDNEIARLPVGVANGSSLITDSTAPLGVRWAAGGGSQLLWRGTWTGATTAPTTEIALPDSTLPAGFTGNPSAPTVENDGPDAGHVRSVQAPPVGNGATGYMEYTITIPTGGSNVTFYRKVESEGGYDYHNFTIDGTTIYSGESGFTGWAMKGPFALAAGTHTLRWSLSHDGSVLSGYNSVRVSALTFTGLTTTTPYEIGNIVKWNNVVWMAIRANGQVTAVEPVEGADWTQIGVIQPAPATGHVIQDEGVTKTNRTNLNFVGPGVAVTDNSGTDTTTVTISGSGGAVTEVGTLERYTAFWPEQAAAVGSFGGVADATSTGGDPALLVEVPEGLMAAWWGDTSQGTPMALWLEPGYYAYEMDASVSVNSGDPTPGNGVYGYVEVVSLQHADVNDKAWLQELMPNWMESGDRRGVLAVKTADYFIFYFDGDTDGTNRLTLAMNFRIRPMIGGVSFTERVSIANTGTAYTVPDAPVATIHNLTMTGNVAFTFPTAVAGKSFMLALKQDGTGSRTATWPSSVKWSGGTAPTLTTTAAKTDLVSFVCIDGTNWLGSLGGKNF